MLNQSMYSYDTISPTCRLAIAQVSYNDIHQGMSQGIQDTEFINFTKILFGNNTIIIPIPSILTMLMNEVSYFVSLRW